MTWVTFDSIESFNAWHDQIKADLGLPSQAIDSEGNLVEGAQASTDYTTPHIVTKFDIRADVESDYLNGLTLSETPYKDERLEAAPK